MSGQSVVLTKFSIGEVILLCQKSRTNKEQWLSEYMNGNLFNLCIVNLLSSISFYFLFNLLNIILTHKCNLL